jgi:hypothetical protein
MHGHRHRHMPTHTHPTNLGFGRQPRERGGGALAVPRAANLSASPHCRCGPESATHKHTHTHTHSHTHTHTHTRVREHSERKTDIAKMKMLYLVHGVPRCRRTVTPGRPLLLEQLRFSAVQLSMQALDFRQLSIHSRQVSEGIPRGVVPCGRRGPRGREGV